MHATSTTMSDALNSTGSLEFSPKGEEDDLEDLTDEQIHQLLQDAERRLKVDVSGDEERGNKNGGNEGRQESHTKMVTLDPGKVFKPYIHEKNGIASVDSAFLADKKDRELTNTFRQVHPAVSKPKVEKSKKPHAGSKWFDLPRTVMTPELKRDLQILRMRSVLDPKRHYKKEGGKGKPPEFSQIGTIIEGPTEFYSARIPNKERKRTFVDEALAYEDASGRFKAKYEDVQAVKTSGKKAHYKALRDKRKRLRR